MATDSYREMVDLVTNVRALTSQQEEAIKQNKKDLEMQQSQIKDFLKSEGQKSRQALYDLENEFTDILEAERDKSKEILAEQKKILKELKQKKYKTYSKYFFVGGSCAALGIALAVLSCFSFSNWFSKSLIEQNAQLKIEQEKLTKEVDEINKVKEKYQRFEKFNDLVSVLDKISSKNKAGVLTFNEKNYIKKTFGKDETEDVLILFIDAAYLTACDSNNHECYIDPATKDTSKQYSSGLKKDGYAIAIKKNL